MSQYETKLLIKVRPALIATYIYGTKYSKAFIEENHNLPVVALPKRQSRVTEVPVAFRTGEDKGMFPRSLNPCPVTLTAKGNP